MRFKCFSSKDEISSKSNIIVLQPERNKYLKWELPSPQDTADLIKSENIKLPVSSYTIFKLNCAAAIRESHNFIMDTSEVEIIKTTIAIWNCAEESVKEKYNKLNSDLSVLSKSPQESQLPVLCEDWFHEDCVSGEKQGEEKFSVLPSPEITINSYEFYSNLNGESKKDIIKKRLLNNIVDSHYCQLVFVSFDFDYFYENLWDLREKDWEIPGKKKRRNWDHYIQNFFNGIKSFIQTFGKEGFGLNNNEDEEVILKNLNEFLNEWIYYEKYLRYLDSNEIIYFYGFTKDSDTLKYMVIINYANESNLRENLTRIVKNYWNQKLYILTKIIISGLNIMHTENAIHRDLHTSNILNYKDDKDKIYISDFGLCQPVKSFLKENDIYSIILFIAPKILRSKSYISASDIYSIMWESGIPPFNNREHDLQFSLSICKGERPEIIENTPQSYMDLMKKCWDETPLKRPSSEEVLNIIKKWIFPPPASDIYSFSMIMWECTSGVPPFNNREHDLQLSLSICEGDRPEIIENTPQSYVDLMKKCWDENPLKRPSSEEVLNIIKKWIFPPDEIEDINEELKSNIMEFINAPIGHNNLTIKSHPKAYFTSRLLDFTSKKLNEILESEDSQVYFKNHFIEKVNEMLEMNILKYVVIRY